MFNFITRIINWFKALFGFGPKEETNIPIVDNAVKPKDDFPKPEPILEKEVVEEKLPEVKENEPKKKSCIIRKLDCAKVKEIKKLDKDGMDYDDIAKIYSVSESTIGRVVRGETYKNCQ